jgi:hypothetical protein
VLLYSFAYAVAYMGRAFVGGVGVKEGLEVVGSREEDLKELAVRTVVRAKCLLLYLKPRLLSL